MDISSYLAELIRSHIGATKKSQKGWEQRNCMLCHLTGESRDTRGRFGIIFNSDGSIGARCFNCRFKATYTPGHSLSRKFQHLLQEIGVSEYEIKKIDFEIFKGSNRVVNPVTIARRISDNWVPSSLPDGSKSISSLVVDGFESEDLMSVIDYAYSRGIRDFNDIYWSPRKDPNLSHRRFILPFRYNGKIIGYTSRFAGDPPSKSIPKYFNKFPPDYIYNIDLFRDHTREVIVLTEGVLDAFMVSGISTCGNTLNSDQVRYIESLGKPVVVCPDFDKDGRALVDVAIEHKWAVSFPNWKSGIKDAASAVLDYGRILTLESILSSAETSPIAINLKWNTRVR